MTDHELIRRYVGGSQDAFAELVRRHLDLVYSAARRQSRSPQMAEEVAQSVFIKLSVSAAKLDAAAPLAAWLFLVTRHTAIDAARQDARRQAREALALELSAMNSTPSSWSRVDPLLDEAMEALPPADRTAILLRYFENKSLREVGVALGSSEDAAQKRVSRAIEELRTFFARRGVSVTAAGLAAGLTTSAVQSAPASLGPAIASINALSGAALVGSSTTIAMTTVQKTFVAATFAALIGAGFYEARVASRQELEIGNAQKQLALAEARSERAKQGLESLQSPRKADAGFAVQSSPPTVSAADMGLQETMARLASNATRLKELFNAAPEKKIPELALLSEDDWITVTRGLEFDTDLAARAAFSRVRSQAKRLLIPQLQKALAGYRATGNPVPDDIDLLLPYFDPPIPREMLQRYTTDRSEMTSPSYYIAEKKSAMVDDDFDTLAQISSPGYALIGVSKSAGVFREAMQRFAAANGGARPISPQQLQGFLSSPMAADRLQELFDDPIKAAVGVGGGFAMIGTAAPSTVAPPPPQTGSGVIPKKAGE